MDISGFFRRRRQPLVMKFNGSMAIVLFIAIISATSCYDDSSATKSLSEIMSFESLMSADSAAAPEGPDMPPQPDQPDAANGAITVHFNVPSMKNARVHGFIYDSCGTFRGEIGYFTNKKLLHGKGSLEASRAATTNGGIRSYDSHLFADGNYTIHGKFDLKGDGFRTSHGDKGFRVHFAVNGATAVTIEESDIIDSCSEAVTSTNRTDLKFATVYAYMYFPGGNPLKSFAHRFDGGVSYVKLNHYGSDLGNTMCEDLVSGVYDVLILADMDDSIDDPSRPNLTNGDKFVVVKNVVIDGIDPIDISDYVFTTYISDRLPAPRVDVQTALNAVPFTIKNVVGAASYNVYGRSMAGYILIANVAANTSEEFTYYTDYGPNDDYYSFGLPADTRLHYRIAAVKSNGAEGELTDWLVVKSGSVEIPDIYGEKTGSTPQLDLLVSIPAYCQEIEITAHSRSCIDSTIGIYRFTVSEEQRGKGSRVSLTDFSLSPDMTYAFTVRGMNMYGDWSEPSACYLFVYQQ